MLLPQQHKRDPSNAETTKGTRTPLHAPCDLTGHRNKWEKQNSKVNKDVIEQVQQVNERENFWQKKVHPKNSVMKKGNL